MNILILSCGAKCLLVDYFMKKSNGFDSVVAVDCSVYAPALYRADRHYIVPRMKDDGYLPEILHICEKEKIDVILPLQEDELVLISQMRKLFEDKGILPLISDYETVCLCRDKLKFYQFLNKQEDIRLIPTYSSDDFLEDRIDLDFPVYVKPRYGAGSEDNLSVPTKGWLREMLSAGQKEMIIQPHMDGQEYGVNAYIDILSGEPVSIFVLQKISMRAGETFKSVSVHNAAIEKLVNAVCSAIRFRGPIDIDIMEYEGTYYVLEVNPRFGGGYPHAYNCGVNFLQLIAKNAAGYQNEPTDRYEDGVVALRYTDINMVGKKDIENGQAN